MAPGELGALMRPSFELDRDRQERTGESACPIGTSERSRKILRQAGEATPPVAPSPKKLGLRRLVWAHVRQSLAGKPWSLTPGRAMVAAVLLLLAAARSELRWSWTRCNCGLCRPHPLHRGLRNVLHPAAKGPKALERSGHRGRIERLLVGPLPAQTLAPLRRPPNVPYHCSSTHGFHCHPARSAGDLKPWQEFSLRQLEANAAPILRHCTPSPREKSNGGGYPASAKMARQP